MTTIPRLILSASSLLFAASLPAQTRTITNQLVVHLTFDDTLSDDSGRANNATYVGNAGLSIQPTAPTYVAGKLGHAFQYNTYSDASLIEYATLGYPSDLMFGTDTDFSVSFWMKAASTNLANDPAIIANRNWNSSSSVGWGVFLEGGNPTVRVHYCYNPPRVRMSSFPNTPGGENLYDGAWHHLAVSAKRGGVTKIYVDGVLEDVNQTFVGITNSFDTDAIFDNGIAEAVNIGQDGTGTYTQGDGSNPPASPGTAGITNAAIDDLGIWRRALGDIEVASLYNFGLRGTNLSNIPDVHTPVVTSLTPPNSGSGILPYIPVTATIVDQDTALNTNNLQLLVDGVGVAFSLSNNPPSHTITYTQPFLSAPGSLHTNKLIFADNGTPTPNPFTNTAVYSVIVWSNMYLPQPLYFENFDEVAPATNPPAGYPVDISGNYPSGWTATNCSSLFGFWDLLQPTSDTYANFQTVPINVIASSFNYGARIYNVSSPVFVNGALVTQTFASNNIIFAASDQRNNGPQADYLFTRDYDLTSQSNVWVAFWDMYSSENGQLGSLEYSIDQGTNWLPVVYMIEPRTIISSNGIIDALATFTNVFTRVPQDDCSDDPADSYLGKYIGVASNQWSSLAPYISVRPGSDHITWHTLEKYRLPQADGQARVRFRFGFAGFDFWDWGFDNFGIYSINDTPPRITDVTQTNHTITVNWNGTGANSASGLQKNTRLLSPSDWVNVPGTIGLSSYTEPLSTSGNPVYYRVVRY